MPSSLSSSKSDLPRERRIYVTGYALKETSDDIKKLFEQHGKIEEFSWKGRFCFVVSCFKYFIYLKAYSNPDEAAESVKNLDKFSLNDQNLVVQLARSKKNNSECYQCGKVGHFARNCRFKKNSSSPSRRKSKKSKQKKRSESNSSSSSNGKRKRKVHRKKKQSTSNSRSRSRSSS